MDCLRMGENSPRKKNQPPLKEMAKYFINSNKTSCIYIMAVFQRIHGDVFFKAKTIFLKKDEPI